MVLNQISDYINGKPTPNHKIRAWGDELKVSKLPNWACHMYD